MVRSVGEFASSPKPPSGSGGVGMNAFLPPGGRGGAESRETPRDAKFGDATSMEASCYFFLEIICAGLDTKPPLEPLEPFARDPLLTPLEIAGADFAMIIYLS
jgi:hypothetical protein